MSQKKKKVVYKWDKLFTDGREDIHGDARRGRPSTSTADEKVEAVKKLVIENRGIMIREVAGDDWHGS